MCHEAVHVISNYGLETATRISPSMSFEESDIIEKQQHAEGDKVSLVINAKQRTIERAIGRIDRTAFCCT